VTLDHTRRIGGANGGASMTWADRFLRTLKENEVRLVSYGFALIANALASLIVPYQIPAIIVVSERGTLGEFNIGQVAVARTMRPVLDSIAVTHHTLTDEATMPFVVDKSIKQAFTTQSPVVFILSPLLTGGNPLAAAKLT
jgi:sulfopyruvate decarboxylase TPP-binding subunit